MRVSRIFLTAVISGISCMAIAREAGEPVVVMQATLSDFGALRAMNTAGAEARKRGLKVSIAVVDADGHLLAFERVGNAFHATIENAIVKASTAAQLGAVSAVLQKEVDGGKFSYLAILGLTPLQGGVPIMFSGKVVGGIASSGAAPEMDELIASVGAKGLHD